MKRRLSVTKLLAVFATTTLIFVGGIFAGQYFATSQISELKEVQNNLQIQSDSIEIKYLLLSENPCFALSSKNFNKELYSIGDTLIDMEKAYGKNNPQFLELSEKYSLLEIRHYMIQKKAKEDCDSSKNLILYFYSNENCKDCVKQGYVLTFLRKKYINSMSVYSFNSDIENPAIDMLKEMHNVEEKELPIVVINGNKHEGLRSADALEEELNE